MDKQRVILTINLGSTSSKVAVFKGEELICKTEVEHSIEELSQYKSFAEQSIFRKGIIEKLLSENGIQMSDIDAIAARGCGAEGRYHAGAYYIDDVMAADCREGWHAGLCVSVLIANEWRKELNIPAFVYDTASTDEMQDVARISGIPLIERSGAAHTLNTKAVARKVASEMGKRYDEVTFIMCHMGGGIGTSLHKNGRIIDVVSIDEGTFMPDRSGRVPCIELMMLCTSGKYSKAELKGMLSGNAGLIAYLGTNDCKEVERRIAEGDEKAKLVYEAMAYQLAKDIGSMAAVVSGKVDRIVLTGGIAYSKMLTAKVKEYVEFLAPVVIVPGSMEMEALMKGVNRVLDGEEGALPYIIGETVL